MPLRYGVLSLVALVVIVFLTFKNYETWTRPIEVTPERNTARKQEAKHQNPPAPRLEKFEGTSQPYVAIAGKNIFSPDRKDFPVQSVETRRIARPQVTLYGVTIIDSYQLASIVNPGRPLLRGERETMSVKVGDKVGDYKLAKISPDRITLAADGDSFDVLLYDSKAPKKREVAGPTPTSIPAPSAASPLPAPAPQVASSPLSTASTPPLPYIRRARGVPLVGSQAGGTPSGVSPSGSSPVPGQTGLPQNIGGN